MSAVDMDRAREEHGHAQAKAESSAGERMGQRYGTESFKQGHRAGYWEGFKRAAVYGGGGGHVGEAQKHIAWAHDHQAVEGDTGNVVRDDALLAQAEAILALVEQQRIANLIALGQVRMGASDLPLFRDLVAEPAGEYDARPAAAIREGLGL